MDNKTKKDQPLKDIEKFKNQKKSITTRIREWFIKNASRPIAEKILYFISFVDSFLSPIPPDPFLGLLTLLNPKKWLRFVIGTIIYSVIGGLVGYLIGFLAFEFIGESLVALYEFEDQLQSIGQAFSDNSFLSIFISAFTPIPYQIFTVSAGLFKINVFIFIFASIIGRGLRFFIVALIMRFIGEKFGKLILKYLNWLLFLGGLIVIVYILFF